MFRILHYYYIVTFLSSSKASLSKPSVCVTSEGIQGVCLLPHQCVGVSLTDIELNPCEIDGEIKGACCAEVSTNKIINLEQTGTEDIELPNITLSQVQNIFTASLVNTNKLKEVEAGESETVENGDPAAFHNKFNAATDTAKEIDESAKYFLAVAKNLQQEHNFSSQQVAVFGLRTRFNDVTNNNLDQKCPYGSLSPCNEEDKYRSIDGVCNSLKNPIYGRSNTPFQRYIEPEYEDSINLPRTKSRNFTLPTPREISNRLAHGRNRRDKENTILLMQMGQFIDHDITHTPARNIKCCSDKLNENPKCFPIQLKQNDPFWKGNKTCMEFSRSLMSPHLDCEPNYREQINQITHWLDGSNIYGSTLEEAHELRSNVNGKLKLSEQSDSHHGYLPTCKGIKKGTIDGCDVCQKESGGKDQCYFAGDLRVNEQLNLIVMHTVFMREHNRVAESLARINPCWDDNKLFEESRRIVVAEYQHIVYKEWLPIVLGNTYMKAWGMLTLNSGHYSFDYADNFDPRINNEFATAAFRFGHSLIPSTFKLENSNGRSSINERMKLKETFFQPEKLKGTGMLDSLMHGMMNQPGQACDSTFSEDIRNHLFETKHSGGGLDLVALNIQRGRDHGLPGYVKYRELCGLGKAIKWSHLTNIPRSSLEKLKKVYRFVEDVDLFVGGFLEEPHEDALVGPVFKCLIGDQFLRLKKGDRFFYDLGNDENIRFTTNQLIEIRKASLAKIICENTDDMPTVQPFILKMQNNKANELTSCDKIPAVNLETFKDNCPTTNSTQELVTARESVIPEPCTLEDGRECVFPFKYGGLEFQACSTHVNNDIDTRPWCPTQVDDEGYHEAGGPWGYCPEHCNSQGILKKNRK